MHQLREGPFEPPCTRNATAVPSTYVSVFMAIGLHVDAEVFRDAGKTAWVALTDGSKLPGVVPAVEFAEDDHGVGDLVGDQIMTNRLGATCSVPCL